MVPSILPPFVPPFVALLALLVIAWGRTRDVRLRRWVRRLAKRATGDIDLLSSNSERVFRRVRLIADVFLRVRGAGHGDLTQGCDAQRADIEALRVRLAEALKDIDGLHGRDLRARGEAIIRLFDEVRMLSVVLEQSDEFWTNTLESMTGAPMQGMRIEGSRPPSARTLQAA